MPKKKKSNNKTKQKLIRVWRWFKGLRGSLKFLVLVLVFAFGMTTYNLVGDMIDKRKLDTLDRNLIELTNRINAEFDTETLAVQRYCKHDGVKFGSGPLVCVVQVVTSTNDALLERLIGFLERQDLISTVEINKSSFPDGPFQFTDVLESWCSFSAINESLKYVYPKLHLDDTKYSGRVLILRCTLGTLRNFYTNVDDTDKYYPLFVD